MAADINAAIAVNRQRPGTTQTVHSDSHLNVVQVSGRAPGGGEGRPPDNQEEPDD